MRAPSISGLSRRGSLLALGAVGISALTPRPTMAKKKANSRCRKQVGACKSSVTTVCDGANCAAVAACCDLLSTCNFTAFAACAIEATDGSPNQN
ncbi:MAG: hypothetical protein U0Z70_01295 [Thermomicrobiales bacterium]